MITPNDCRKNVGCWSCQNGCIQNIGNTVEISCASEDAEVCSRFHGWETAQTCKGFRMKPYAVAAEPEQ